MTTGMTSRYTDLSREELAVVVPELLLIGQLIDRSGMAWCIAAFGREEMLQVAIEEWAAASPIYTRRMQQALGYAPAEPGRGDVVTIFKGLQLDIGAPPQFMDFRFTVHDPWRGEFRLDHCGALMDVEPMGEDYVRGMCHDIEDPTFDATAIATNPHAQIRPIHRPPHNSAERAGGAHCAWTVTIDESHPTPEPVPALEVNERSRAATLALDPIDPADEGRSDYSGPLLSDLDFAAFSRSALVRIADEVCLQMHLLDRAFALAVAERTETDGELEKLRRKQLVGVAGIGAERLARALGLLGTEDPVAAAVRLLSVHPLLNPAAYVDASLTDGTLVVRPSPAHEDEAWISLCGPARTGALQAVVRAVDPHLDVEVEPLANEEGWRASVVRRTDPAPEASEVAVTRFSTGAGFTFQPRRSLPITPV
ncbi:hypothetical protein L615_008700000050 [Nocardioides sp. J9]|uniref:hypothetical protein n=1 Tax=Nocardioides sp. J9 TaxID=935844 RepID=UPI0011AC8CEF|nr:hypothetical protein [Nocardioides sp. J9]TWG90880.1 hypothetical protein L615_008700000050 [Nocardioides sp. J9]